MVRILVIVLLLSSRTFADDNSGQAPRAETAGVTASSAHFEELPADLPLPAAPVQGLSWTRNAIIIQPWGYTQRQMMRENLGRLPEELREKYGFNVLCVMPPKALAAVGGGDQSEAAFTNALAAYRKAGYKIVLYSSLVNAGHDPSWYRALKEHPEWRQINPAGKGADWLCPNSGAFDFNLRYTKEIVARYGADGMLLDNNFFASPDDRVGVACYCEACEKKFRAYVTARFGEQTKEFFGVTCDDVKIPEHPGPLYNLWKHWRNRSLAEATEQARRGLKDIMVVANTQYWWWTMGQYGWALASDLQYPHEDMVLSESYATEAYGIPNQDAGGISTKLIMGRAIAGERPLCDLIGTFEWNAPQFEPLKPAPVVQRRLCVALMYLAQPWLGYYGMEGDEARSGASRAAMSRLLQFRSRYPELYTQLQPWGGVGFILPNLSYNCLGPSHPVVPPQVVALRNRGVPVTGLYDLTLTPSELANCRIVVAEKANCLSPDMARVLVDWMQAGGTLVATAGLGDYDEIGRPRPRSKVADLLGLAKLRNTGYGRGRLLLVSATNLVSTVADLAQESFTVEGVGSRKVEFQAYADSTRSRLVLHITNHGAAMTTNWGLELPEKVAAAARGPVLYLPTETKPLTLAGRRLTLSPLDAYGVVVMKLAR